MKLDSYKLSSDDREFAFRTLYNTLLFSILYNKKILIEFNCYCQEVRWEDKNAGVWRILWEGAYFCLDFFGSFCIKAKKNNTKVKIITSQIDDLQINRFILWTNLKCEFPSSDDENLVFSFLSIGSKGVIVKLVVYEAIETNKYNLAFGDYDLISKTLNDTIVTNNGDGAKVLASVVNILFLFFTKYPDAEVYLQGSNELRTKLYQRIIRDYALEYNDKIDIKGTENSNKEFEVIDFSKNYVQFRINVV